MTVSCIIRSQTSFFRQLPTICECVLHVTLYVASNERADNDCVPLTESEKNWKIQQDLIVSTSPRCRWQSSEMGNLCAPLTYTCKCETYRSTNETSFSLKSSGHPPVPGTFANYITLPNNATHVINLNILWQRLLPRVEALQEKYKPLWKDNKQNTRNTSTESVVHHRALLRDNRYTFTDTHSSWLPTIKNCPRGTIELLLRTKELFNDTILKSMSSKTTRKVFQPPYPLNEPSLSASGIMRPRR